MGQFDEIDSLRRAYPSQQSTQNLKLWSATTIPRQRQIEDENDKGNKKTFQQ